jgi:hypothetical protein
MSEKGKGKAHDMTGVFWPFISMVANMPYDMLRKTHAFNAFKKVMEADPAFRIHMSAVEDLDADVFYDAMPLGMWADGEWMYFTDVNKLFWCMHEIYERQPDSERRTKMMRAMRTMETIAKMNDTLDAFETLSVSRTFPRPAETQPTTESIENLISQMSISAATV